MSEWQPATAEQCVMSCPQCEGEGFYADGIDEGSCSTECTRCGSNGWIADLAEMGGRHSPNGVVEAVAQAIHEARSAIPWGVTANQDVAYRDARAALAGLAALAIETHRAETGTGSVHESAGPQDKAQSSAVLAESLELATSFFEMFCEGFCEGDISLAKFGGDRCSGCPAAAFVEKHRGGSSNG